MATIGTVAGYDSGQSSAYATLKTTVTDPTAPSTVTTPTNVAPSSTHNLTWSGAAAGTNNAISTYEIHRSTDGGATYSLLTTDSASPLAVTAPSTNGGTYSYKVKTVGARSSSGLSSAYATLTTTVGAPSVPTAVSVTNGTDVAPGKTRTLSWSGAANGTNNTIKGYHVYRSVNGGAYAYLAEVLTTATSGSLSVTAASSAATYTYKVLVLGNTLSVNSALSSAYGTLTTVTIPSTGVLTTANIVATGSEKIGVTLTAQAETSYTHKVTWHIPVRLIPPARCRSSRVTSTMSTRSRRPGSAQRPRPPRRSPRPARWKPSMALPALGPIPTPSWCRCRQVHLYAQQGQRFASGSDANVATISPAYMATRTKSPGALRGMALGRSTLPRERTPTPTACP